MNPDRGAVALIILVFVLVAMISCNNKCDKEQEQEYSCFINDELQYECSKR